MKRLLAAMVFLVAWAVPSFAALGGGILWTEAPIKWRTSAAATVGVYSDSLCFTRLGGAAATRDTSAWIDISDMAPWSAGFASAGDSTMFLRFTLKPRTTTCDANGTALTAAADSLYSYWEFTDDPSTPQVRLTTNMTEILSLESNSDNTFLVKLSWARAALSNVAGSRYCRVIVRALNLNGVWEGSLSYYAGSSSKSR